jgi:hypothetical protein
VRFFKHNWFDDPKDEARVPVKYQKYLRRISAALPKQLRRFSREVNVHDGLFRQVVLRPRQASLTIKLRCGDLQVGYQDVDIIFGGVVLPPQDRRQLRLVANRKRTEVLDDEVDIAKEGTFEYRFTCWPDGEVSIGFQGFSYRKTPVKGREFVAANPRFRVIDRRLRRPSHP